MRIAMIGCMVMNREISLLTAKSENIIRVWWLRQGLHDTPDVLRAQLQKTIDEIEQENQALRESQRFQAIVLAYGLCSNGVIGLRSRSLPIIVPRGDDCISLFLGSAERYRMLFREMQGVYWYNRGWIEQSFTPSRENYEIQRQEYVRDYGEENADYLMECTNSWMTNYKCCAYISSPLGDEPEMEAYAKQASEDFGWEFRRVPGSMMYLEALVNGPWNDNQFLICLPESRIEADYTDKILQSKSLVPITAIAKDYGMSGQALNKILHGLKIIYRIGNQWLLYSKYQACGYTSSETVQIETSEGPKVVLNTKWTQKGRLFLYEMLKKQNIIPMIER